MEIEEIIKVCEEIEKKDVINKIFKTCEEIQTEFFELLSKKHPELIQLYRIRYEYIDNRFPPAMRIHNAYVILRTYLQLLKEEK
jgi:hypothetical protein